MQNNKARKKILCVGVCTLDIVQVCENFPLEDSDERCIEAYWQRGGNASNNCTVLSQLGINCEFLGTFSKKEHLKFLTDDFHRHNIDISNCVYYEDFSSPMSTVILSRQTGSRTILHTNPNLPGLTINDFKNIDINNYEWIHFEGRNIEQVCHMMESIKIRSSGIGESNLPTISVDVEKGKMELRSLIPLADVIFISKDFALYEQCENMIEAVNHVAKYANSRAIVICAWGDKGAAARDRNGEIFVSSAYPPEKIIDTLGAGDTFCAAVITGLLTKKTLQESITLGCTVAGAKIGIKGYCGLNQILVKH